MLLPVKSLLRAEFISSRISQAERRRRKLPSREPALQ